MKPAIPFARVKTPLFFLAALAIATLAVFALSLLGKTTYSPDVWTRFPTAETPLAKLDAAAKIFWGERLPKTVLAALAGAALALAGLTMQTLFRNDLATPYTLGIASGASFGATLSIQFSGALAAIGLPLALFGVPQVVWGSFGGAALAVGLVLGLSRRAGTPERVLLAGVATGFFFSSLVLCQQYLANPTKAFAAIRWTTGGVDLCEPGYLATTGGVLAVSALYLYRRSRELDALTLGDERAKSLGVEVDRLRVALFLLSSALVAVVVAFCGPIGFVGLTVPHVARLCVGGETRRLIPATLVGGALFLAVCYTFSRIVLFPSVLPVGVVTSLLGGPFFLWILLRAPRR
ncbi:MAG: iron ABC transporter permease [Thermoguttaceae bacterium]|nr:iron ABC transporter permease [Thermoguttaceae bacterium]